MTPAAGARRRPAAAAALGALLFWAFWSWDASPALAQADAPNPPGLQGRDKQVLLLIAREAVAAALENRPSREARVGPRLQAAQPLVASIYVDGRLRARAWKLKNPLPLYQEARDLITQALADPKVDSQPLSPDELARARVGLAVLGKYSRAKNETEVPPRSAVIIYNGFTEWLALPGDAPAGGAAELLSYACEQAGLRPQVWLLPSTAIFSASADEARE